MPRSLLQSRRWRCSGLVLSVVFAWELLLWLIASQPIPANDAFFYDGAVVNLLLHGQYVNPSIALALPISGTRVFSAYPPLYQVVLLPWLGVFGTTVQSAMALHLILFGVFLLGIWATFQRLGTPAWCANFGALFVAGITFHDRPDSLAHAFGAWAIHAWIRSRPFFVEQVERGASERWTWISFLLGLCCLGTSFQIGAVYLLLLSFGMLATRLLRQDPFPLLAWRTMVMVGLVIVAGVAMGFPGFMEHAQLTPSLTGPRLPGLADLLKVAKAAPGVCLLLVLLPMTWFRQRRNVGSVMAQRHELALIVLLLPASVVLLASLAMLTPNTIAIATYLQPVAVGCYLVLCRDLFSGDRWLKLQVAALACALLVNSLRAIGISTWGLVCASEVSRSTAIQLVDAELSGTDRPETAVISSAYLYEAAKHPDVNVVHSDWPGRPRAGHLPTDVTALRLLEPRKLILTQFDYYRRYQPGIEQLLNDSSVAGISVKDTAGGTVPDSIPSLQRVIQHISWAPVIVTIDWKWPVE